MTGLSNVGGLAGTVQNGTLTDAYSTGSVTGTISNSSAFAGGLVGNVFDSATLTNTYASGAQNVGVRLLDNAEANITLGSASEVTLLAGSATQTLHFKAQMEVLSGKTATPGQVEATANYVLAYK